MFSDCEVIAEEVNGLKYSTENLIKIVVEGNKGCFEEKLVIFFQGHVPNGSACLRQTELVQASAWTHRSGRKLFSLSRYALHNARSGRFYFIASILLLAQRSLRLSCANGATIGRPVGRNNQMLFLI